MKDYNLLLKKYTRYIEKLANSWANGDDDLTKDLEQVGNIRLFEIMDQIQEDKGEEVSYVTTMIKFAMKKYLTNNLRTVRIPVHRQHGANKDETLQESISLSSSVYSDGVTTLIDTIVVEEEDKSIDDEQYNVLQAIKTLKEDEQYIILNYSGYHGDALTLQEIATNLGVTKQAVSLRLQKIKDKIKAAI